MNDHESIARQITTMLAEKGDPERAIEMAAYMKTTMPFYGVQAGERDGVLKAVCGKLKPKTREEYEALVQTLWDMPHREEKYIAVRLARRFPKFITLESLPLNERMIREGAWWDFVDEIAGHLVGQVLRKFPDDTWPILDKWIEDDDMWIRRTAVLAQKNHKDATDEARLFDYCLRLAHEEEFFIRKAIGWALREYSYVAPDAVREFLASHRENFSNLIVREASKRLK